MDREQKIKLKRYWNDVAAGHISSIESKSSKKKKIVKKGDKK